MLKEQFLVREEVTCQISTWAVLNNIQQNLDDGVPLSDITVVFLQLHVFLKKNTTRFVVSLPKTITQDRGKRKSTAGAPEVFCRTPNVANYAIYNSLGLRNERYYKNSSILFRIKHWLYRRLALVVFMADIWYYRTSMNSAFGIRRSAKYPCRRQPNLDSGVSVRCVILPRMLTYVQLGSVRISL